VNDSDPVHSVQEPPLALVQAQWPAVLEELNRRQAHATSALASCARPARLEDDVLVVQFGIPALLMLFQRGHHRRVLAAAVEAVLGQHYPISLELVPPAGQRLACAKCGTTHLAPWGMDRDRNAAGTWVSGKILRVYFQCEKGHLFKVEFGVHDRETFTRVVIGPSLE
jgi:hypothetical protein